MSTLNEQALEDYNRLSKMKLKSVEETKQRVIEQLNKSQQIFEKYV
jgi:hypothetical protein